MLELTLRLFLSLGLVIALLVMITKWGTKRAGLGGDGVIQVLSRRSLSRGTSVHVVLVGQRVLVIGASEQHVEMLAELDPEELEDAEDAADVEIAPALSLLQADDVAGGSALTLEVPAPTPIRSAEPSATAPSARRSAFEDALLNQISARAELVDDSVVSRRLEQTQAASEPQTRAKGGARKAVKSKPAKSRAGKTKAGKVKAGKPAEAKKSRKAKQTAVTTTNLAARIQGGNHSHRAPAGKDAARKDSVRHTARKGAGRKDAVSSSPLEGSILSGATWRQAFAAARRRSA